MGPKFLCFKLFIMLFISTGCTSIPQYEIGEIIEVFVEDPDETHNVLFSFIEHKGNNIKIVKPEPSVIDYISSTGNTYIKLRILRKSDDPEFDYEALYPHTDYKEYEVGDVLTGILRGTKYWTNLKDPSKNITEHRFVHRDGNIIKLVFSDPEMTHLETTHERFEATEIKIKIIKKVKNKKYDYEALYIETLGRY